MLQPVVHRKINLLVIVTASNNQGKCYNLFIIVSVQQSYGTSIYIYITTDPAHRKYSYNLQRA